MKTTESITFTTVGKLLEELNGYNEESLDYSVAVWVPDDDDSNYCIVSTALDEDGDLCIDLEEMQWSEGYYDVQELIDELEEYDKDTKVYLAGCGLYLNFEQEGGVFCEPSGDDEIVGSYASVFGHYEEKPQGWFTEEEKRRRNRKAAWKARTSNWKSILEGIVFLLCIPLVAYGLYYNIAALVKHSRPVWESALWIPFLVILLWVCLDNLFFSRED